MVDSREEARLIELSHMSAEERLHVSQDSEEVRGYLQALEYLSSMDPPALSQTKMWAGHARLMASLEDSRPAPLLARLLGRTGLFVRTAPIALAAAAVIATASSAAVITDAPGSRAVFSEVLSALGIHEALEEPVNEAAPALTPTAAPRELPINSRPGAFEEPPLGEDAPQGNPAVESNGNEAQEVTPADQQNGGVGQGGTPPGQGGANPGNGVGQEGTPPGQGGANPGNGVGQEGTPPGQGGTNPGNGGSG